MWPRIKLWMLRLSISRALGHLLETILQARRRQKARKWLHWARKTAYRLSKCWRRITICLNRLLDHRWPNFHKLTQALLNLRMMFKIKMEKHQTGLFLSTCQPTLPKLISYLFKLRFRWLLIVPCSSNPAPILRYWIRCNCLTPLRTSCPTCKSAPQRAWTMLPKSCPKQIHRALMTLILIRAPALPNRHSLEIILPAPELHLLVLVLIAPLMNMNIVMSSKIVSLKMVLDKSGIAPK